MDNDRWLNVLIIAGGLLTLSGVVAAVFMR
jgi:hypothetical protein